MKWNEKVTERKIFFSLINKIFSEKEIKKWINDWNNAFKTLFYTLNNSNFWLKITSIFMGWSFYRYIIHEGSANNEYEL